MGRGRPALSKSYYQSRNEKIIELATLGKSIREIAIELNIGESNLYLMTKKLNLFTMKKYDHEQIIQLHQKGFKRKEIQKILGCGKTTVRRHLCEYGL